MMQDDEPATRWQRRSADIPPPAGGPATIHQRRTPDVPPQDDEPSTTYQRRSNPTGEPPTRLQRPGTQPAGSSGPGEQGVLGELGERFTLAPAPNGDPRLGSGAEADVWLARHVESDRLVALKIYKSHSQLDPKETFDVALRQRLADPALTAHVPELHDWGWAADGYGRQIAWEAMEYFELGSLADLVQREADPGGELRDALAQAVVRATVDALVFWEDIVRQRQIDLSPGNIMVRSQNPLQLVLSDFGGVRGTGLSQEISNLQVKIGYMAPEALGNGNHPKSPYWSLGMICYHLVVGRSMMSDRDEDSFKILLATDDIDVSTVADPRWRLLIEGLLTRSTHDRWGAKQVRSWLAGGSPAVHRLVRAAQPIEPLRFGDESYDDRRLLAGAMTVDSDRAAEWLHGGGATQLRAWLAANFEDRPFDVVHLSGVERSEKQAHLAVSRFAATFIPDQRPHYRGWPIDEEGLLRLAQDPGSHAFLHQIIESDALHVAALHHCSHPGCASVGHCRVLQDLGTRVSGAATRAMDHLDRLGGDLTGDALAADIMGLPLVHQQDLQRFYARAVQLLVSSGHAERVVASVRRRSLPRARWWSETARAASAADPRTAEGVAALIVAEELLNRAAAYRRAEDRQRRLTAWSRIAGAFTWLGEQFTRKPSGRQRMFAPPRWISMFLLLLIPVATVEPTYWLVAAEQQLDPDVVSTADRAIAAIAPYTGWVSDWLTPHLTERWPTEQWKAAAAYPVVMLVTLAIIRRTRRRGSAVRSWLALPAAVAGVAFGLGLLMHLVSQNFYILWISTATLGFGVVMAPVLALIAVRIVAGRAV